MAGRRHARSRAVGLPGAGAGEVGSLQCLGEAEVGHHCALTDRLRHQKDVVALEVEMKDASAMRGLEAMGDLVKNGQCLLARQAATALDPTGERFAPQQLHGQDQYGSRARLLGLVREDVEDPTHIDVGYLARKAGFVAEALERARVGAQLRADDLERDLLAEKLEVSEPR